MEPHNLVNGTMERVSEISVSDRKPIVTFAGDKELFLSLEATLCSSLPQEAAEWRRAYGRAIKSVNVTATFVPFSKEVIPKEGDFHLIDQPMFHTYWTQCSDVEFYKSNIRDEIEVWMKILNQFNADWMIVVVETYDFRKSNKLLPRTTVYDKVKSDFGAKHADRCLSVINPLKSESRSAGSWRGLVVNTRLLLLSAFDKILLKFEETIREQRERRNQAGWSFTKYFLLQEELAFVLEMLGVYEEALVQYDELDALFTQFVVNSNLGESPGWLTQFQAPLDSWEGLNLTSGVNLRERSRIETNICSALQFRDYLFSRQCAMLLYSNKPSEVAERTLPFLHNCLRELSLLEVSCPRGAVSSWVFLSSIEILHICDTFADSGHIEHYSKHTAAIWAYARQKLADLGELCGLLPGQHPSSEQLHLAVEIFSGLGDENTRPIEKLKKALSNQKEFCKQYLELSELAMGTYKHIGRVRCARSLGRDLAEFYRSLGDDTTAASFLQSALLSYEQDGWKQLAAHTRLQLVSTYRALDDLHKYAKICISIASSEELDIAVREDYYNEALNTIEASKPEPTWICNLSDCLTLTDIDVIKTNTGSTQITATLGIVSHLPVEAIFQSILIAVSQSNKPSLKHKDSLDTSRRKSFEQSISVNLFLQKLPLSVRLDYQQDRSLAGANVDVKSTKSILRRQDSHGKYRKISNISKSDYMRKFSAQDVLLKPGVNTVTLSCKESEAGQYRLGQVCACLRPGFELLSIAPHPKMTFDVVYNPGSVSLIPQQELLAGLQLILLLRVHSNSDHISQGSKVRLKTSIGLTLQPADCSDPLSRVVEVQLPQMTPHSSLDFPLRLYCQLSNVKDSSALEHTVMVKTDWKEEETELSLSLTPVLSANLVMHTALQDKFLLVTVTGHSSSPLLLHSVSMASLQPPSLILTPVNPPLDSMKLVSERKIGYMWKFDADSCSELDTLKTEFILHYRSVDVEAAEDSQIYRCTFDINNYKTLYLVECWVEPGRGSEFCRVSTVCQLKLRVSRLKVAPPVSPSLMYEVLAEHNMWAVCGRTAGVLSLEEVNDQTVTLDVMPLINGYLPLPSVRLSKYIPANTKSSTGGRGMDSHPRLEPFCPGQVYYMSKGSQVHVISAASPQDT